jgi:hypothetical protein
MVKLQWEPKEQSCLAGENERRGQPWVAEKTEKSGKY